MHGNKSLDTTWVTDQWDTIVRAAKLSLLKKIEFLQDNPIDAWQDHLDKLALGV